MEDKNNFDVILVFLLIVVGYLFIFHYQKVRKTKCFNRRQQPAVDGEKKKPGLPPLPFVELTEKQLSDYDGNRPDGRILIAFKGNIYDVSTGLDEFGCKGALGCVAGKNFTEYLNQNLPVSETKINFIQRWEMLLDKNYERVGILIDDDGKKVYESDDNQEKEMSEDSGERKKSKTFEDSDHNHKNQISELSEEQEKTEKQILDDSKEQEKYQEANDRDDNQEKQVLDDSGEQNMSDTFIISDDDNSKLGGSSVETITNDSIIEVNDTTVNLMKDLLPDEMLENELPPNSLTEELI
ncbi:hypothetical protein ACLKA7_004519 [Drosophila subpalustris]